MAKKTKTTKQAKTTRRPRLDGRAIAKALRNAKIERGRGWVGIRFF